MIKSSTLAASLLAAAALVATEGKESQQQGLPYSHPGIVAFREGRWLGSDHLLNISNDIAVYVEISKPENVELPVTAERLKTSVQGVFKKAGINIVVHPETGKPTLPFFHILVMLFPIKDGYTFSLMGSLYEEVKLPRITLDDSVTMQAITWDRQSIHIGSTNKVAEELINSVDEMATNFVERYTFFEKLKKQG